MLKWLIFVQGLTAPKDKDIRSRMEQDPEIRYQKVTEEGQKLINIKHDKTRIERKNLACTTDKTIKSPQK